ncbi:MAG: D-aminoacyl-tRNA deacylase [Candidatus Hodarchaeales archaeon]
MDVHLFVSRKDNAGMNIAQFIHSSLQKRITVVENLSIFSDEEVANLTPVKSIIYLSRHSAQSLRPSFTVHSIGNFGVAEFGGLNNTLVKCNSFLMKRLLLNIQELKESGDYKTLFEYEIRLEVTHHGPFSKSPVVFIEVGSSEAQWKDLEACRLISDAVNNTNFDKIDQNSEWVSVIGFGGNHYATKFTRMMLETEYAFGHICAKYAIIRLDKELIYQMITKTLPTPELVLFEKKNMKRKQQIRTWLSEFEIEVKQI